MCVRVCVCVSLTCGKSVTLKGIMPSFQDAYMKNLPTLSGKIMSDPSHILYEEY